MKTPSSCKFGAATHSWACPSLCGSDSDRPLLRPLWMARAGSIIGATCLLPPSEANVSRLSPLSRPPWSKPPPPSHHPNWRIAIHHEPVAARRTPTALACTSRAPRTTKTRNNAKNHEKPEHLSRLLALSEANVSPLQVLSEANVSRLPWSKRPPPATRTGGLLSATSSGSEKNLNCPGVHVESDITPYYKDDGEGPGVGFSTTARSSCTLDKLWYNGAHCGRLAQMARAYA